MQTFLQVGCGARSDGGRDHAPLLACAHEGRVPLGCAGMNALPALRALADEPEQWQVALLCAQAAGNAQGAGTRAATPSLYALVQKFGRAHMQALAAQLHLMPAPAHFWHRSGSARSWRSSPGPAEVDKPGHSDGPSYSRNDAQKQPTMQLALILAHSTDGCGNCCAARGLRLGGLPLCCSVCFAAHLAASIAASLCINSKQCL